MEGDKGAKAGDKTPAAKEGEVTPAKGAKQIIGAKSDTPIAQQRARIDELNNKVVPALTKERDDWKGKFEALQKQGGGDTAALTAKIEAQEAEVKRLSGELAARDYSQHPDYKEKFEKPFNNAAEYAKRVVSTLQVVTGKDANEQPILRNADWKNDFASLYSQPRNVASQRAREMFGQDAGTVMTEYDNLHRLEAQGEQARADWSTGHEERTKASRAEEITRQQNLEKAFKLAQDDIRSANPKMFGGDPDDKEGKDMFDKAFSMVQRAFSSERASMAPQEVVALDANIALRAADHVRLERVVIPDLLQKIADLEARVKGEEESTAGRTRKGGEDGGDKNGKAPADMMQDPLLQQAFANARG